MSPNILHIDQLTTPLGQMTVCATSKGICLLEFDDTSLLVKDIQYLQKYFDARVIKGENEHIKSLKIELAEYFSGARRSFDLPLDIFGTDFQKKVWKALIQIPYGKTSTYQYQANIIDNPKAVRAVGSANGQNKVAIIVPCHRIIGTNGKLTGYAGGVDRKRWLIDFEKTKMFESGYIGV